MNNAVSWLSEQKKPVVLENNKVEREELKKQSGEILLLSGRIKKREQTIKELTVKCSRLNNQVLMEKSKNHKKDEVIKRINALNDQLSSENKKGEEAIKEKEALSEELERLKADFSKLDNDYVNVKDENESLSDSIKSLTADNASLQEKNKLLEDEISALRNLDKEYVLSNNIENNGVSVVSYNDAENYSDIPDELFNDYEQSDYTNMLFNNERPDYQESDLIEIKSKKESVIKNCNFLSKLFSKKYENKFLKKPPQEQINLIFVQLMSNSYSPDVIKAVKSVVSCNPPERINLELYRLLANNSDENRIKAFLSSNIS